MRSGKCFSRRSIGGFNALIIVSRFYSRKLKIIYLCTYVFMSVKRLKTNHYAGLKRVKILIPGMMEEISNSRYLLTLAPV